MFKFHTYECAMVNNLWGKLFGVFLNNYVFTLVTSQLSCNHKYENVDSYEKNTSGSFFGMNDWDR